MPSGPFVDSAATAYPAYSAGSTTIRDTTTKLYGSASFGFPGSTSPQRVLVPNAGRFALAGDFTLEFWTRPQTSTSQSIYLCGADNGSEPKPAITRAGTAAFTLSSSNLVRITTSGSAAINTWHHLALTRSGSTMTLWLNGVSQGTYTNSSTLSTEDHQMGGNGVGSLYLGNTEEVRWTPGVVRYTGTFTPPAAAFPENSTDDPSWASVVCLLHGDDIQAVTPIALMTDPPKKQILPTTWPFGTELIEPSIKLTRYGWGGNGQILGTVKVDDSPDYPVSRLVRIFRERDGICLGQTWSSEAGNYAFIDLDPLERYSVVAYDHTFTYNAVISSNQLPTL